MQKDFIGLNGYVWWVGVVERRDDPLKLGRLRVRIYGWHSDNVNLLPPEDLPWAQVLLPVNNAKSYFGAKEGDWVSGFFLDGENGQQPVVLGVFPGIVSQEPYVYKSASTPFVDKRTQAEIDAAPKIPTAFKDSEGKTDGSVGQPTTPRLNRGIVVGTAVNYTNLRRSHVCDITPEVQRAVAIARIQFGQFIETVRNQIRALILALSSDPTGIVSTIVSMAKKAAVELKRIRDIIAEINDYATVIISVIRKIRAIIDYILGLPERIAAFVRDCLTSFFSAIATGVSDLVGGLNLGSGTSDFGELITAIREVQSATVEVTQQVYTLASVPASAVAAITTPTSASEIKAAEKTVTQTIGELFPTAGETLDTNSYKRSQQP